MKCNVLKLFFLSIISIVTVSYGATYNTSDDTTFDLMQKEALGFLRIDLTDKAVIDALGPPQEKTKLVEWAADGLMHQTWKYKSKGIELGMAGTIGRQRIELVSIKAPCQFKSARGIGIGSSREDVEKAYAGKIDCETECEKALIAGSIYGGMMFGFVDRKVIVIYLGAFAE